MRNIFQGKLFMSLLAIVLVIASCKKGDDGAAGAAGATGPAGPAGSAGAQGPQGVPGTANVIYSEWLDVAYLPDTVHTGAVIDTLGFFADILPDKLDSLILANGEIKVYLNAGTPANPAVFPLPYWDPYSPGVINPTFFIQDIFLYSNFDAGTITVSGAKRRQYRYILVPGGEAAKMAKRPNWKDYNAVKAFYGIKD
ncbi:MAG: hypothetical protein ABI416_15915 [Ginsengibacter sp.]